MPLFNVAVREHTYTGRFYGDVVQAGSPEEALRVAARHAAVPPPPGTQPQPGSGAAVTGDTRAGRPGTDVVQASRHEDARPAAAAPGPPPGPAPRYGFSVVVTEQADSGRVYSDVVQAGSPEEALQVAAVQAAAPEPPPGPTPQAAAAGRPRCADVWVYALLHCELEEGHDPPHMVVAHGYRRPVRWVRDDLGVAHAVPDPVDLRTDVPHPARIYDYWLGGTDNFAADRAAAEAVIAVRPTVVRDIRANRAFLRRAVAWLASEAGVGQFLDIGAGIPTKPNVHEVVQAIIPAARIVYVDHDPIVLSHARALLASGPEGETAYIDADLRAPAEVLAQAARTLDFTRPVALLLVGVLHLISDDEDPNGIIARLMEPLAPGSYLVVNQPASDVHAEIAAEGARRLAESGSTPTTRRSRQEVVRFFSGLDLVEPGVVQTHRWHPEPGLSTAAYEVSAWAAVGRKN
jgi:hypothetical protein